MFLAAAVLLTACDHREQPMLPLVPYVSGILADRSCSEAELLGRISAPESHGSVCIIGPEDVAYRLAEEFSERDAHDNVDGSHKTDLLPDFAGETASCIVNDGSFRDLLASEGETALRERSARLTLLALDTLSHISPFDMAGLDKKYAGKVIILADPYITHYGKYDVDYLFGESGCSVPVLSPLNVATDEMFRGQEGGDLNVGIMFDGRFADASVYEMRFRQDASERGAGQSRCFAVPTASDSTSVLRTFFDSYIAAGLSEPIDALIVDDTTVDTEALKNELVSIISVMNESSLTYGPLVSGNFRILSSTDAVLEMTYGIMRKQNLFTHNISKPQVSTYRISSRPGTDDGSLLLISGSYVQN